MPGIDVTGPGGILLERWDDATRLYTDFRTDPDNVRDYTAAENAAADARATTSTRDVNRAGLADPAKLAARLTRLAAYDQDPDIVAALARPNTTAPTTAEMNRLLKVMLRRDSRLTATLAAVVRLIDPTLLDNITDTTDS